MLKESQNNDPVLGLISLVLLTISDDGKAANFKKDKLAEIRQNFSDRKQTRAIKTRSSFEQDYVVLIPPSLILL